MRGIEMDESMTRIFDLLPPLQCRILMLKMQGWEDSEIFAHAKQIGLDISSVQDIREQIDQFSDFLQGLGQAMDIINHLYPDGSSISNSEFEIGIYSRPALFIPGDFYDIIIMDESRVGLAVGDGTGHGFGAALLSASAHAHLHTYAAPEISPSKTLSNINHAMCQYCIPGKFVTLLYGILHIDSRSFLFSHAAHPHLLHYKCNTGTISRPKYGESNWIPWPFGNVEYFDERVQFEPGDVVVTWTDGIIESLDSNGTLFGQVGLESVIKQYANLPAQALAERIYQSAVVFSGASSLHDDATVIVLKRRVNR